MEDSLPVIVGAVLLVMGAAFAFTIGIVSGRDEDDREHSAGS